MSIAVYLESIDGKITGAGKEAAGFAKKIAESNGAEVIGVILDADTESATEEASSLGIKKIKVATIDQYNPKAYANHIEVAAQDSDIIVLPTTTYGHEIGGYVTISVDGVPVTDVVDLRDGKFIRSIHSNGVLATINTSGKVIATCRTGSFDAPEESVDPEVETISAEPGHSNIEVKSIQALEQKRVPLTEASIVVSAGRGVGEESKLDIIEELADVLDAAVGATRAIVDDGWMETDLQVGQTGKTVSPDLYIAAGISGAIQHITGMKTSNVIVSINTDPEAPIFKISNYGIVADLHEVVPVLTKKLKERKE